jgi:hypothetical protein
VFRIRRFQVNFLFAKSSAAAACVSFPELQNNKRLIQEERERNAKNVFYVVNGDGDNGYGG